MPNRKFVALLFLVLTISLSFFSSPVFANLSQPGQEPLALAASPTPRASSPAAASGRRIHFPLVSSGSAVAVASLDKVNTASRQEVLRFYQQHYLAAGAPVQWTGSQASCDPGTTSPDFQQDVLERINYFRAMAGVPAHITFSDDLNRKAQSAALMMSAAGKVSHSPSSGWACYSAEGAGAAASANLFLGDYSWNAITGYMRDFGSGNAGVGHRRWLLYPQTQTMGTGDVPASVQYRGANVLVVLDGRTGDPRPATRDNFVSWPPPGFVPAPVVFARWSFSYPQADFSNAAVSMRSNGASLPVSLAPVENGYGENTLVWIPLGLSDSASWPRLSGDTAYTVTVNNVLVGSAPRSFSYTVTVFNP